MAVTLRTVTKTAVAVLGLSQQLLSPELAGWNTEFDGSSLPAIQIKAPQQPYKSKHLQCNY